MNKTIWKFELMIAPRQTIDIPVGAEILTVQTQDEKIVLWALVEPKNAKEKRFIDIFGTGHDFDIMGNRKFLGTVQLKNGSLAFHVFENNDTNRYE